jgi:hypothetical protein
MADYPLFKLCSDLYEVVPAVLLKTGKVGLLLAGGRTAWLHRRVRSAERWCWAHQHHKNWP